MPIRIEFHRKSFLGSGKFFKLDQAEDKDGQHI